MGEVNRVCGFFPANAVNCGGGETSTCQPMAKHGLRVHHILWCIYGIISDRLREWRQEILERQEFCRDRGTCTVNSLGVSFTSIASPSIVSLDSESKLAAHLLAVKIYRDSRQLDET
jgi:hypothetical protein